MAFSTEGDAGVPAPDALTPVSRAAANGTPVAAPEPLLRSVLFVARQWRRVLRWTLAGACVAAAVAAIRPRQYVATAAFVAVSRQSGASNVTSLAGTLGLAGLQSDAESPQFYADLIHSPELLLAPLREPLPVGEPDVRGRRLVDLYGTSVFGGARRDPAVREENALEYVGTKVIGTAITAKTGVVRLTVKTRWAPISQWLARRLLAELNAFNIESRRTQAGEERRFAEQLVRARRDSLSFAERRLEEFTLANRQYSNSPTLALEAERLRRETALQLSLLTSATSQYEDARLREVRDTPTIMMIEAPRVPARALPSLIVPLTAFGAILGAIGAVVTTLFVRALAIERERGDPEAEQVVASLATVRRQFEARAGSGAHGA